LAYLEAREEQLVAALRPLLGIVEDELADDPEPDDLESWHRAIGAARAALHLDGVAA